MLSHVQGAAGDHCTVRRGPGARRGRRAVRRPPFLGVPAPRPLPGRGRGSARAALPTAEDLTDCGPGDHGRGDRQAPQGAPGGRTRRRPRHHRLAPRAPRRGPGVGIHGGPHPDSARPGHPATCEATQVLLPAVRSRPTQRDLAVRLHPLPAGHRSRHRDPDLARRPLPLRTAHQRPCPGHRPHRPPDLHQSRRPARLPGVGAHRQRHGLHRPVRRRPRRPHRPGGRAAPTRHRAEELQAQPPHHLRQGREIPTDPEEVATRPTRPADQPDRAPGCSSTPSPSTTTSTGRTAPYRTGPPRPPPTPPAPRPPPARWTAAETPTTGSATTGSASPAPSPCASRASCATSASAEPTPEPTSSCSSKTSTSESSTPLPANYSATWSSTPDATTNPPDKHPDQPRNDTSRTYNS